GDDLRAAGGRGTRRPRRAAGPMMSLLMPIVMTGLLAQAPNAAAAINAAKDARAKTEEAQKKNSEALDPQGKPPAPPNPPAQGAPAHGTPPQAAAPPTPGAQQPEKTGPGYTYDPAGRRDPFVSLLGRGGDLPTPAGSRPAGLPGLLINEVTLKGVLKASR